MRDNRRELGEKALSNGGGDLGGRIKRAKYFESGDDMRGHSRPVLRFEGVILRRRGVSRYELLIHGRFRGQRVL